MTDRPTFRSDDEMIRVLAEALDIAEPVPAAAVDAAYAAVDMDRLHEELAALVFDSRDQRELVLMRATEADTRMLSFVNDHLSIDLELHADGQTVVGQLTPPSDAPLLLELEDGTTIEVPTDEFGRFRITAAAVPFRLRVTGLLVTPLITR